MDLVNHIYIKRRKIFPEIYCLAIALHRKVDVWGGGRKKDMGWMRARVNEWKHQVWFVCEKQQQIVQYNKNETIPSHDLSIKLYTFKLLFNAFAGNAAANWLPLLIHCKSTRMRYYNAIRQHPIKWIMVKTFKWLIIE